MHTRYMVRLYIRYFQYIYIYISHDVKITCQLSIMSVIYIYIHIWLQMWLNIVFVWSKSVRIFERARRSLALSVDHGVSQTQRISMAWFKVQVQVRGDHCGFTTFYPKTAWVSWVSCTLSLNIPKNQPIIWWHPHDHRETVNVQIVHKGPSYNVNTFRYSNMAMENTLFISDFPIETPTSGGFS